MIDKYWNMYVDCKIAEYYYSRYSLVSKRWDTGISAFCLIASASSISAWYIWKQCPMIWAVIIGISQIVSICKSLFPFSHRVAAAEYILQDLGPLVREIDTTWGFDGCGISDSEFGRLIQKYESRRDDIENRFAPSNLFPENQRIHKRAQESAAKYFESRFHVDSTSKVS